jgi:hypothetical protein
MRAVDVAVVRRRLRQDEMLRKRWIIDLDGLHGLPRHGRSHVWTPGNQVEVSREDGVCYIVHGGGRPEQVVHTALSMGDPFVLVVFRSYVSAQLVGSMLKHFAKRRHQTVVVVGPDDAVGAIPLAAGSALHVTVEWDDDGVPVAFMEYT